MKLRVIESEIMAQATMAKLPPVYLNAAGLDPLLSDTIEMARKLGVSSKVVTAAQNLDKKMTSGEVSWAPQLRELLAFKQNETVFGTKFALNNMVAVAPEMDRSVVADVMTRAFGEAVSALKL
jgi:phosphoserine aminotransferase